MNDRPDDRSSREPTRSDAAERDEARRVEQEARRARSADLASLLASRDAGSHLRGASPTPVVARALLEVRQWLASHLRDHEGSLTPVLLRHLAGATDLLESNLGRPQRTVARWLEQVLARPNLVADLVRETDRQWGQQYQERPHFERPGEPPDPDDPYTVTGVTAELERLQEQAAAADRP